MRPFLESLRSDGVRFAEVVRSTRLDTTVPSCPGWTVADLAQHMAYIHRWVTQAVLTCARPPAEIPGPEGPTNDELADHLLDGVETLVRTLEAHDESAPTWHPFNAPQVLAVWPRRQAQETMIHRWDAENAVGGAGALDPAMAADGILEYFEIIVPRVVARDGRMAPTGVLRIECPEEGFVCTVSAATTVDVELGDGVTATPDATIRGTSPDVLLALWRRVELPGEHTALAAEWLRFGGN
jgi:uncharacterized protein (TIGR03083 family)